MDFKMKGFFLVLLGLKAIVLIQSAELSFEHDVTKQIDGWISKIFKFNADATKRLFSRISQRTVPEFMAILDHHVGPLGDKLQFRKVFMNLSEYKSPQIHWKFSENKMSVFIKEYTVKIIGKILNEYGNEFSEFQSHLDLLNVTFTLSINAQDNASHEFTYDDAWIWYREKMEVYFYNDVPFSETEGLQKDFLPIFVDLLRENLKHNEDFKKSIRTIFKTYSAPRKAIVETHSDFFTNSDKYYYLIPKIPFFCFNLKNVFIKGLWNLEWIKINTGLSIFTHTLMIRNVHGSLQIDFGTPQEKPVELQFKIDYFSVSIDKKSVNVDARCYSVNKTNTPLSYRQSALIMQRIESAVASSLLPSLTVRRTYEIDTPLEQIKITEKTDWKVIKSSFHEWIPFNDDPKSPAGGLGAPAQTRT